MRSAASTISGIPNAPVVTVAGEQPNALAVALNDQAIAVVLDLVNPFRPVRNLGAAGRNAGLERDLGMRVACGPGYSALAELRYPHLDRHNVVHSINGELPSLQLG